jgi:hypothetical protein
MSLTNQYLITLTRQRDGKDFGRWQTHSGGKIDSSETTTRDGFGLPRKQLGGPATRDAEKLSRVFYPETDNGEIGELEADAGHTLYLVGKQKLDPEGNAIGAPRSRVAMLKSVEQADVDVSDDSPSADRYTVELSPEGP